MSEVMKEANQAMFFCWFLLVFSPPRSCEDAAYGARKPPAFCNSVTCYNLVREAKNSKYQISSSRLPTTKKHQLQLWQMLQLLPFVDPVRTYEAKLSSKD